LFHFIIPNKVLLSKWKIVGNSLCNFCKLDEDYSHYFILEYADVVWDIKTQILINKLENVQVEAVRIVTGGTRLVSLSNLYIETGWEKLKNRRERHRTIQFYKMSNNLTPQYFSNLIPQIYGIIHDHNTRHTSRIPPDLNIF
jgi:hypothetical protein